MPKKSTAQLEVEEENARLKEEIEALKKKLKIQSPPTNEGEEPEPQDPEGIENSKEEITGNDPRNQRKC